MSTNDAKQVVTQLQRIMLRSILKHEPLPGQSATVSFADLAHITERDTVFVSDKNVGSDLKVEGIGKQIEVLPEEKIRKKATESGDLPYVHFRAADYKDDQVRLIMDIRIAPPEADIQTLGLGAISATFHRTDDGRWEVHQQPDVIAM